MIAAIKELQGCGVEPDVWKIEGLDRREDAAAVAAACRRDGRDKVGCILLGRGSNEAGIVHWLREAARRCPPISASRSAAPRSGSRSRRLRDKQMSRDQAVGEIADNYLKWVRTFEDARKG